MGRKLKRDLINKTSAFILLFSCIIISATGCGIWKNTHETDADTTAYTKENNVDIQQSTDFGTEDIVEPKLDPILEKVIRQKLGYSDAVELTSEDYESITSLEIFYEDIRSIDGISMLKNLTSLSISGGSITDISELVLLENIVSIDIYGNLVREIPDFSNCKELTQLYLTGNLIEDVEPLNRIGNLEFANISDNRVKSIKALADSNNIGSIAIDNNCILDYESISKNEKLISAINNGSQATYEKFLETEQIAQSVVSEFPKGLSELELEKYIYQYVMDNMEYEVTYRDGSAFGYYALTSGIGVCGDYAELFCILANHAGLEAYVCGSETHAWNIVVLDGKKYHCDALWDEGQEEWVYFNLSGEEIAKIEDHFFDDNRY